MCEVLRPQRPHLPLSGRARRKGKFTLATQITFRHLFMEDAPV